MRASISFLFLFFFNLSFGQQYAYKYYSTPDGLPQSQVTCISQDKHGYLWVGTLGGIAKFNGSNFQTISSENGLYSNRITSFDRFGDTIWVGHDGGVTCVIGDSLKTYGLSQNDQAIGVTGVQIFKGVPVVATNGAGVFKIEKNKLIPFGSLTGDSLLVRDIQVWNNCLYFVTRVGLFKSTNLSKIERTLNDYPHTFSGIDIFDNKMYISSWGRGVFILDKKEQLIERKEVHDTVHRVNNILVDSKGIIWLTSQLGLIKITKDGSEFITTQNGLPSDWLTAVFEDSDKSIWLGSMGKGLIRSPKGDLKYFGKSSGLSSDLFVSGSQKSDGSYYLGSFNEGLIYKKGKDIRNVDLDPRATTIWSILLDVDGKDWIATKIGLYGIANGKKVVEFDQNDGTPGNKITTLYKVNNRRMLIGGKRGVAVYDNGKIQSIAKNSNEIGTVRSMAFYRNVLYVGTDFGVFYLKNQVFIKIEPINHPVYSLLVHDDNLWLGTESGLFRFREGELKQLKFANEITSNNIVFLNEKDGRIYAGTNNGLYVFSGKDIFISKEVKHFGLADGLVDLESNVNSSFFDKDGYFWFGTASGLMRFDPAMFDLGEPNLSIQLTNILLNYKEFDYKPFGLNEDGLPKKLELPYNKNNLLFEFDVIALGRQDVLYFQYWLEGLDESWAPATKNTSISYSGLPAGEYILHARIIDVYGNSKHEINYSFIINSPFYARWWFILIVTSFITVSIWMAFKFKLKREREKNENEKLAFKSKLLALEQQSLNASMNRHFIFNALNSIQYFINTSDKLAANKYLTNFAKLIRKNLDSSVDEGNTVTLAQELERIELYLSLESMRFKDRFVYSITNNGVDSESVLIPAMLIQPFVENSIIHGILPNEEKMGEVKIEVNSTETGIDILIEDNGIGIEQSLKKKSSFDGDHRSQGMEITFKRIDLIRKVSNQDLEIIGPNQIENNDHSIKGTAVLLKIKTEYLEN